MKKSRMHPVFALVRLFGPLARYYTTPGRRPVDGSPPPRGDHTPVDNRDQDAVCEAGRYLRALGKMERASVAGGRYRAILESYYSKEGIPLHRMRMERVIEDLDKRGMMLRGSRRKSKIERIHLYTELLQEAIEAYGRALRSV